MIKLSGLTNKVNEIIHDIQKGMGSVTTVRIVEMMEAVGFTVGDYDSSYINFFNDMEDDLYFTANIDLMACMCTGVVLLDGDMD